VKFVKDFANLQVKPRFAFMSENS